VGQVQKKDRKKKSRAGKRVVSRRGRERRFTAESNDALSEFRETPMGYNIYTIVIMPVNMNTSFIYWEVTDKLLNGRRKGLLDGSSQLMLKVFETDLKREIYSFPLRDRIGKHYLQYRDSFNPLVAEIGMLRGKRFTGLLRSSPATMQSSAGQSSAGNAGSDEVWMKKTRNTHEIVSMTGRESVKKNSRLHSLIMHYYHAARTPRYSPLSSGTLAGMPWAED
jgi:hypothetical protein